MSWNQSNIKTQNYMSLVLLPPKYAYISEVRKWNLISQQSQKQTFKLKNSRMALLKSWKKSMWIKVFIHGQKPVTINVTKRKMKHFQKSHVHEPSWKLPQREFHKAMTSVVAAYFVYLILERWWQRKNSILTL